MLDHYDVRSGYFTLGIRPPAGRRSGRHVSKQVWNTVHAILSAAAELDATVYGARVRAERRGASPS